MNTVKYHLKDHHLNGQNVFLIASNSLKQYPMTMKITEIK